MSGVFVIFALLNKKNNQDMVKLSDKIFYVGVNDKDKVLFEGLWPLP